MRNIFFILLFRVFSDFERNIFQTSGQKNFKKFSKLPSTCPEEQFVVWIFFKNSESFWISCRNLWHGSQNSIYVSRVKIAEDLVFFVFLFRIFFEFLAKFFQTFGQKTSRIVKLTCACADEQFLAWIFFLKFWVVLGFLQKPLA